MGMEIFLFLPLLLILFTGSRGAVSVKPDEAVVRYILADIALGGPLSFYRRFDDPNSVEAVRRWEKGVRVRNSGSFQRINLRGKSGWTIVYKGTRERIDAMKVHLKQIVIKDKIKPPSDFRLEQNYPNPFNPWTVIGFDLPKTARVTLAVYTVTGRKLQTILEGERGAGRHAVTFNAGDLSSGTYIYKLEAGRYVAARKMMLIR